MKKENIEEPIVWSCFINWAQTLQRMENKTKIVSVKKTI